MFELYEYDFEEQEGRLIENKLAHSSVILKAESLKLHILHLEFLAHGVACSDSHSMSKQEFGVLTL